MRHSFVLAVCLASGLTFSASPVDAQAHPRHVGHSHSAIFVGVGAYYHPFLDPWYLYPWYPYPFAGYPPYGPYVAYDVSSSVKLEVTPNEAEVYVDGYLTGTVDDFDGFFQRLHVPAGQHTIELHLDGYRSVRQDLFLTPTGTYRLRYKMEPLPAGEQSDPRPTPPPRPEPAASSQGGPDPFVPAPEPPASPSRFGTLSLRAQPDGVNVLVDGEGWEGPASTERLIVQLSAGRHHLEIRKDGYRPYESDVTIEAGRTNTLNVSLPPNDRH